MSILFTEFSRIYLRSVIDGVHHNFSLLSFNRMIDISSMSSNNDVSRLNMLLSAIADIKNRPFNLIGDGIENAKISTSNGDGIVIHMTYFQVWLDYGILGFLSYLSFFILLLLKYFKIILDPIHRKNPIVYIVFFVVFSYAFASLFHPLSNEINYWAAFILFVSHAINTNQRKSYYE